jgi:abortive infection bacteriophage resistance protein
MQSCGLAITDVPLAESWLQRAGYYRLSGYWYMLRTKDSTGNVLEDFKHGSTFADVVNIYVFDKRFRLLLLDAIERIEIAMRVRITHEVGGIAPFPENDSSVFDRNFLTKTTRDSGQTEHQRWCDRYAKLKDESKEIFIAHFKRKYNAEIPIWVGVEVWDFGMLSIFYSGLAYKLRQAIATQLGLADSVLLVNWLRTLNFIRNVCAHHSRLWNRKIVQPRISTAIAAPPELHHLLAPLTGSFRRLPAERVYGAIAVAQFLMQRVSPNSHWPARLKELMRTLPATFSQALMGFPPDWETLPLWK